MLRFPHRLVMGPWGRGGRSPSEQVQTGPGSGRMAQHVNRQTDTTENITFPHLGRLQTENQLRVAFQYEFYHLN